MKLFKSVLYLIVFIAYISCDPDDNDDNAVTASILGTWRLVSITFGNISEPVDDCERMQTWTYKENGELELYFDETGNCDFSTRTQTYILEDNILQINFPIFVSPNENYLERNTIQVLTSSTLQYIETFNNLDGELHSEDRTTYVYSRVNE
jgi:hypothetical protein